MTHKGSNIPEQLNIPPIPQDVLTSSDLFQEARKQILALNKTETNYDHICNMEINELAEFIHLLIDGDECDYCAYKDTERCDGGNICIGGIIKFLKAKYTKGGILD